MPRLRMRLPLVAADPGQLVRGALNRKFAIPEAETFMMLRRYHEVFHACLSGHFSPRVGISKSGLKRGKYRSA